MASPKVCGNLAIRPLYSVRIQRQETLASI
jgi:hypothetical protein